MATPISASEFDGRDETPLRVDWRYVLGTLQATYRAPSFAAGAQLVSDIAAAADAAVHHPDVSLHYPGRVHVTLTTHELGGVVTDLDVDLAATISQLAEQVGATSEPERNQAIEVAIDVMDIGAVRPFWKAVLGYVDDVPPGFTDEVIAIRDPRGAGPAFWFQKMTEPRPQRNRFHIDVTVPHDVADERIASALAAGGTMVSDEFARAWWILADAEGNEVCICTWQDRA